MFDIKRQRKASTIFTFAFHLPNSFSLSATLFCFSTFHPNWVPYPAVAHTALPVSPFLPLYDSCRQWPSAAAWVLQAEGWCPTGPSIW